MGEYRAGQRVRIEGKTWAIEGLVSDGGRVVFAHSDATAGVISYDLAKCEVATGVTVTVLADPRPDEPTGLGAVVEASLRDSGIEHRFLWVRCHSIPYPWLASAPIRPVPWDDLIDPVILSEGWQP